MPGVDHNLLCVTPANLAGQLGWLQQEFDVVPLTDLLGPRRGRPRLALTFDDGYADNLHHALPVLEAHGTPATVFVSTGQVGSEREFWWDELERYVFLSAALPKRVRVRCGGAEHDLPVGVSGQRAELYRQLHGLILPLRGDEQDEVLAQVRSQVTDPPPPRPSHRALTRPELGRLATSPLVSVGGHTVHHPSLACRPEVEQEAEVRGSLEALREWTGRPVNTFSYPFGRAMDIGEGTPGYVARAGCLLARANSPGLVTPGADRYRLPGLLVGNWPAAVLRARLAAYLSTGEFDTTAA
jgi:peptidoglycan/xylan/chitin deacetylase (PgdA/CDA1 family)